MLRPIWDLVDVPADIDWFDACDQEEFTHDTLVGAVAEIVDGHAYPKTPILQTIDALGEVEVRCFRKKVVEDADIWALVDNTLDQAHDEMARDQRSTLPSLNPHSLESLFDHRVWWCANYGNPDAEPNHASADGLVGQTAHAVFYRWGDAREQVRAHIDEFLAENDVWQCDCVGLVVLDEDEVEALMRGENPSWFANEDVDVEEVEMDNKDLQQAKVDMGTEHDEENARRDMGVAMVTPDNVAAHHAAMMGDAVPEDFFKVPIDRRLSIWDPERTPEELRRGWDRRVSAAQRILRGELLPQKNREMTDLIAEIAHEANRVWQRACGEVVSPPWADAPEEQRLSCRAGVAAVLLGDVKNPRASHDSWLAGKLRDGWRYGPTKDPEAKTHPCCLPYDALPAPQRHKDVLFTAIVDTFVRPR